MSGFPVLSRYGRTRLRAIAMPVGGIGTGCFALAGDGALVDWQLMSRPHRGWRPPLAHLLLWVRMPDGKRYLRVLEGMLRLQLDADHGVPQPLAGIPRMRAAGFEASYPFGRALLRDPLLPLEVSIEAFQSPHPRGNRRFQPALRLADPHRFEPGQAAVGSVGDFPADQLHRG
jgi:non-lysosomal glucosylceramidase